MHADLNVLRHTHFSCNRVNQDLISSSTRNTACAISKIKSARMLLYVWRSASWEILFRPCAILTRTKYTRGALCSGNAAGSMRANPLKSACPAINSPHFTAFSRAALSGGNFTAIKRRKNTPEDYQPSNLCLLKLGASGRQRIIRNSVLLHISHQHRY